MIATVSHLGTLRDSLFHQSGPNQIRAKLHTHGQLTLVRGALENASMVLWLLGSENSVERILRRIQKGWSERRELNVVREKIDSPSSRSMREYEEDVSSLLSRIGDAARVGVLPARRCSSSERLGLPIIAVLVIRWPQGAQVTGPFGYLSRLCCPL
jgi:hypothetical protein